MHAGETVTIVISDITRLCGTSEFLPVIVAELNSVGVKDEDITVLLLPVPTAVIRMKRISPFAARRWYAV